MLLTTKCAHAPKLVYGINGVAYYGADLEHARSFDGDLVVNFTTYSHLPPLPNDSELAKHMNIPFREIMIPWPDMGVPDVKDTFWVALHKYVVKQGYKHVCFHCHAGHGRTGTALSAMLVANSKYTAAEAVDFVRQEYCSEVVESFKQTVYLKQLDVKYNNTLYTTPYEDVEEEPYPSFILGSWFDELKESEKDDQEEEDSEEVQELDPKEIKLIEADAEESKIIFD